jgi:hypothetical protein
MPKSRWNVVVLLALPCTLYWGCSKQAEETPPAGAGLKRVAVGAAQARAWGLPPTAFSFTYPEKAELELARPGRRNPFYALVSLHRNGAISESVSVSHVDLRGGPAARFDTLAPVVMKRLGDALRQQLPGLKVVMSAKGRLGGRVVHQIRTEFEIKERKLGDPGAYRSVWVALLPRPGAATPNGASLTLTVRQGSGSEIAGYDDFTSKGLPGQIWRSFKLGGLDPL